MPTRPLENSNCLNSMVHEPQALENFAIFCLQRDEQNARYINEKFYDMSIKKGLDIFVEYADICLIQDWARSQHPPEPILLPVPGEPGVTQKGCRGIRNHAPNTGKSDTGAIRTPVEPGVTKLGFYSGPGQTATGSDPGWPRQSRSSPDPVWTRSCIPQVPFLLPTPGAFLN